MIEKNCLYCGKEIPPSSNPANHTQKYCCSRCAKKASQERRAAWKRGQVMLAAVKARKPTGLERCMQEADRLGISYGQYMARKREGAL